MAEPLCKYFGKCGGCSAQHIDYSMQLENKKKVLAAAVGCDTQNITVYSDKEYYYRNRMDFVFNKNVIGFREKGNWRNIIDIDSCVIANERLNILLKEVRDYFLPATPDLDFFDVIKHKGTLRFAVIRTPQEDSSISFVLNSDSTKISHAIEKIKEFARVTSADNIIISYVPANSDVTISEDYFVVKGKDTLTETLMEKRFNYNVQGFFQNNHAIAELMHNHCSKILSARNIGNAHLLDLYGGVGTFGIINSNLFKSTLIIESFAGCIDAAKENIEINNLENTDAKVLDAKHINRLKLKKPLYVITDPPRSGMHQNTIRQLNLLKPEIIVYISCNVKQLSKDLRKFKGYKNSNVALFDMFPQTPHSEAVVELVKSSNPTGD